jgi:hypothetical protein
MLEKLNPDNAIVSPAVENNSCFSFGEILVVDAIDLVWVEDLVDAGDC